MQETLVNIIGAAHKRIETDSAGDERVVFARHAILDLLSSWHQAAIELETRLKSRVEETVAINYQRLIFLEAYLCHAVTISTATDPQWIKQPTEVLDADVRQPAHTIFDLIERIDQLRTALVLHDLIPNGGKGDLFLQSELSTLRSQSSPSLRNPEGGGGVSPAAAQREGVTIIGPPVKSPVPEGTTLGGLPVIEEAELPRVVEELDRPDPVKDIADRHFEEERPEVLELKAGDARIGLSGAPGVEDAALKGIGTFADAFKVHQTIRVHRPADGTQLVGVLIEEADLVALERVWGDAELYRSQGGDDGAEGDDLFTADELSLHTKIFAATEGDPS